MPETWRLIQTPAAPGAQNMALDQALLEAIASSQGPPTLRLYTWDPPCLSLGHAQPTADIDLNRLTALGWDWVRRPTGGRAILHTHELTYAVVLPADHPLVGGGVLDAYRRLSQGLATALLDLGVPVEIHRTPAAAADRANPVCFEVFSVYELTVQGRKLVGSAQVRRGGGVLQHGSLPLTGDVSRICQALRYPDEEARAAAAARLQQRAATLEACLGRQPTWEEVAQAVVGGFARALRLELVPGECTAEEAERMQSLVLKRYAQPA
ncbi:MAG: lipoate--protein ligase family protein [Chloroflexota bacterium]